MRRIKDKRQKEAYGKTAMMRLRKKNQEKREKGVKVKARKRR